jgi:hypothetical protein
MKTIHRIIQRLALLALATLNLQPGTARAQVWKPSGAPFGYYWSAIACSADGTKLVTTAQFGGISGQPEASGIFVSRDAGATWTQTSAPTNIWSGVASSTDGTRLVACETGGSHQPPSSGGHIYISTDSGTNWTPTSALAQDWTGVASSADGKILIGSALYNADGTLDGSICVSTNSGATWTPVHYGRCVSVACSADGSKLFAGPKGYSYVSQLLISTNFGATWNTISDMAPWSAIACSADGVKLVAAYSWLGSIYTSTNSGTTWTEYQPGPYAYLSKYWDAVASSADGVTLVAAEHNEGIWTSTNSGATWEETGAAVSTGTISSSVAVSASGVRLMVAVYNAGPSWQGIWTAVNPPWLSIAPSAALAGQTAVISWPTNVGATLQQNSDLTTTNWTVVTNAVNVVGDRAQVLMPSPAGNCFFRLLCP